MLVIGLTGGIGSGKTTVSDIFKDAGVPIIDADVISRHLTEPGQPTHEAIKFHFGDTIINQQGEVDRKKLRDIVFTNPTERAWLENLIHPLVKKEIETAISHLHTPYCIVSIPLLVETGPYEMLDRVLVVDIDPDKAIERVASRDSTEKDKVKQIINAQASRENRLKAADDIIENNQDLDHLTNQVVALEKKYQDLANQNGFRKSKP